MSLQLISAKYPGFWHDARIMPGSQLATEFEMQAEKLKNFGWHMEQWNSFLP